MTTKGNLQKADKILGKFSLKVTFVQFRMSQEIRGNTGYSCLRCSWRKKRQSTLGLIAK